MLPLPRGAAPAAPVLHGQRAAAHGRHVLAGVRRVRRAVPRRGGALLDRAHAAAHRGGRLSISDLPKYRAVWRGTMQTPVVNHTLHFPDIGKDNKFGQNVFNSIISKSPKLFEPRIFREG